VLPSLTRLNRVVELGARETRYVCMTCGASRDDGDNCAVAPLKCALETLNPVKDAAP
jgi:hypothetical protein